MGVRAGQMFLPYEEITSRGLCKLVTGFSIISTAHSNQAKGRFMCMKSFLNTSISKKPIFTLEVVI
jgi:hypothetical protein